MCDRGKREDGRKVQSGLEEEIRLGRDVQGMAGRFSFFLPPLEPVKWVRQEEVRGQVEQERKLMLKVSVGNFLFCCFFCCVLCFGKCDHSLSTVSLHLFFRVSKSAITSSTSVFLH